MPDDYPTQEAVDQVFETLWSQASEGEERVLLALAHASGLRPRILIQEMEVGALNLSERVETRVNETPEQDEPRYEFVEAKHPSQYTREEREAMLSLLDTSPDPAATPQVVSLRPRTWAERLTAKIDEQLERAESKSEDDSDDDQEATGALIECIDTMGYFWGTVDGNVLVALRRLIDPNA